MSICEKLNDYFSNKGITFKETNKKISWSFNYKDESYNSFILKKDVNLDLFIYVKFFVIRHYYEIANKKYHIIYHILKGNI